MRRSRETATHPTYLPRKTVAEFSVKAVVLGSLFGIAFGAANAYLGLRVGLTIFHVYPDCGHDRHRPLPCSGRSWEELPSWRATCPRRWASASSSLASGIIFTIPAIWLWGLVPDYVQVSMLAAIGWMSSA